MRHSCIRAFATAALVATPFVGSDAQSKPTIEQFLSPAFPSELVSAKKADRVAWIAYDRGQSQRLHGRRAGLQTGAPDEIPRRRRHHSLRARRSPTTARSSRSSAAASRIATDGSPIRAAIRTAPIARSGRRTRMAAARGDSAHGAGPALSPDGHTVAFATRRSDLSATEIAHARDGAGRARTSSRSLKEWGRNANPRWSPDGSKLAFVSVRDNHSFIGVYDVKHAAPALRGAERRLRRAVRRGRPTASGSRSFAARARRSGSRRSAATEASEIRAVPERPVAVAAAGRGGRGGRGGAGAPRSRRRLVSRRVHGRLYDFVHGRRRRGCPTPDSASARGLAQPAERSNASRTINGHRVGRRARHLPAGAGGVDSLVLRVRSTAARRRRSS